HAFWYFIEEKYKKENVTYFLYLARLYKNLNRASMQVCKLKFKDLLAEFMEYEEEKYDTDIRKRKPYPKGQQIESFDVNQRQDYYRINVNPNKKNNSFVLVEFKKGFVKVKLYEDFEEVVLLKYGTRSYRNEVNPDYPLLAWDPKGTRITVMYSHEGRLKLFVYDLVTRIRNPKLDLTDQFQQVQDVKYMLDSRTLLLSATKNGHSDIFTLNLENEKVQQITNDVYSDIDPSYVALPGKNGIMFASNRPSGDARGGDSSIPSHYRYNIFFVNNANAKAELNQITQLSNLKYGNARYPMPYNINHFTFVSDENGVANRYAGFFTTRAEGLDTLVIIGDEFLRNPSQKEVDSTLKAWKKTDIDSVAVVAVSTDSTYTFPLSNYESNLAETRVAGDNQQVSEVTRQSDEKVLYKLKIDENTLRRRNITVPPTSYMRRVIMNDKIETEDAERFDKPLPTDSTKTDDLFQNTFEEDPKDSSGSLLGTTVPATENKYDPLSKAKLYPYKPVKFGADYGGISFSNAILFNRYQQYGGGAGPIMLGSNTSLNGLIRLGTSELMEDQRIFGGFRLSTNLKDNEWLFGYENYKKRFDWGLTYYRNAYEAVVFDPDPQFDGDEFTGKVFSNIYMGNISYPFDRTKRVGLSFGVRNDRNVIHTDIRTDQTLKLPNTQRRFALTHAEYVYDNSLNPTQNIWTGLRYKVYFDWNTDITKADSNNPKPGKYNFNWGFDVRYYYPIYRNFIWAGRAAAEFSWGSQKTIYYLGGADGWLMFGNNTKSDGTYRFFNPNNVPSNDDYAFQTLLGNMRGFVQNVANGNNAVILNSEFRLPVWTTFFNRPINNAFVRNFQLTQFIDLGTAWNGAYKGIARPSSIYGVPPVQIQKVVGGVGPFAGGYGFGARSMLLGYFLKVDVAWEMNGLFKGKPLWYLSLGLDF
ncbi:MAG TPA: hypothetical protein PLY34_04035, partial [Ferruginibacter sp.]|nr:hypothetical protein [Ferruginibacter sp.]HPH90862.1 hypothetical protein [Ferruginibacter sp.]